MQQHLFVYGPWSPGFALYPRLENLVESRLPATVRGSLFRTELGFPVFVNDGRDLIHGELLALREPYRDRKTLALSCVAGGTVRAADIFAVLREQLPAHAARIPRGDWLADARRNPDLLSRLNSEQRKYLEGLRTAQSVEDLAADPVLYRQLLKLNLIEDSGARGGLSPLGQEALEFLREAQCLTH